jgi:hypothetical protein
MFIKKILVLIDTLVLAATLLYACGAQPGPAGPAAAAPATMSRQIRSNLRLVTDVTPTLADNIKPTISSCTRMV